VDLLLRADADDARGRGTGRPPRTRHLGVARAGDGLRHGRLLQLRRAHTAAGWLVTLRPVVRGRARVCRQRPRLGRPGRGARVMAAEQPRTSTPDLSAPLGWMTFRNPLMAASGCFGYGVE